MSTPLGSCCQPRRAAERRGEPPPRVVAEVGHDVDVAPDPAQHLAGAGQQRPADLVAVGRRDGAVEPERAGEQPERRRGAEPHAVAALRPGQLARAPQHVGHRQHQRARVAHHRERLAGVEGRRALPRRGVDDDLVRGLAHGQRVHERLDAAGPRREVVRDDERPHRPSSPRRRSHSRTIASRSVVVGWVANSAYASGCGLEVRQVRQRQPPLRVGEDLRVAGQVERVDVGAGLDRARDEVGRRRDHAACRRRRARARAGRPSGRACRRRRCGAAPATTTAARPARTPPRRRPARRAASRPARRPRRRGRARARRRARPPRASPGRRACRRGRCGGCCRSR